MLKVLMDAMLQTFRDANTNALGILEITDDEVRELADACGPEEAAGARLTARFYVRLIDMLAEKLQ